MGLVLGSIFLFNLLCGLVPCDVSFDLPEISSPERKGRLISSPEFPTVMTKSGGVEGFRMTTTTGRRVAAFEGIQYGRHPIGIYRFRPPLPITPWEGVRDAKKPGDYCTQLHLVRTLRVIGSEACLFLNIYTPRVPAEDPSDPFPHLPVIIYFHGGSFLFGAGSEYGPAYLLNQDLILVTVNWRVGVLGFLSTGDEHSPGNYGLKDQSLAMKWIYENIEGFGGDSKRITLMGQSAGASSVHLHFISNHIPHNVFCCVGREYFGSGISLSGSAFLNWGITLPSRAKTNAKRIASYVRCPTHNTREMVECLRKTNAALLVAPQLNFFEWIPFPPVIFGPVVEPKSNSSFLHESPDELYRRGEVAKYPWISTLMAEEGHSGIYVMTLLRRFSKLRANPEKYLPIYLDYNYLPMDQDVLTEKISQFYFGNSSIYNVPTKVFAQMQSDRYFNTGIIKAIKAHSRLAPTYSYFFSYVSQYNMGVNLGALPSELGAGHGEDMFFFFNSSIYSHGFKTGDPENSLSQILINFIYNFAKNREPVFSTKDGDLRPWEPSGERIRFLEINTELKMIPNPLEERVQFWESLSLPDFKFLNMTN